MKGCGCLIAVVTGFLGIFFWPLWLLTIVGVIMYGIGSEKLPKQ